MASRPRKGKGKRGTARVDVAQPTGFNALEIAEAGRRIYERHRIDFERRHQGHYVLVDVRTEKTFVAASPERPPTGRLRPSSGKAPSTWSASASEPSSARAASRLRTRG